jgi:hypothetical protein
MSIILDTANCLEISERNISYEVGPVRHHQSRHQPAHRLAHPGSNKIKLHHKINREDGFSSGSSIKFLIMSAKESRSSSKQGNYFHSSLLSKPFKKFISIHRGLTIPFPICHENIVLVLKSVVFLSVAPTGSDQALTSAYVESEQ